MQLRCVSKFHLHPGIACVLGLLTSIEQLWLSIPHLTETVRSAPLPKAILQSHSPARQEAHKPCSGKAGSHGGSRHQTKGQLGPSQGLTPGHK